MDIQLDIKDKLLKKDSEYGYLILDLLKDIEDGRISEVKIKERLMVEITSWVMEEGEK